MSFKVKSKEEIAVMATENPEALAQYMIAKRDHDNARIQEVIDGKASKEDIDAVKTEIIAKHNELVEQAQQIQKDLLAAKEALVIQGNYLKGGAGGAKKLTLRDGLLAQKGMLSEYKTGGSGWKNLVNIKAVGDMSLSGNVTGEIPQAQLIPGLDLIPTRRATLYNVVPKAGASSNLIAWVYQEGREGSAGGTAEAATKNQIDFNLVRASQEIVKRTARIRVSTEMLDDIDFMESEIRNELLVLLLRDIESTMFSGNGTAPNMNGYTNIASAFAAGTFATGQPNEIDNANELDVLIVAMKNIMVAQEMGATPNYVFVHPDLPAKLMTRKVSATDQRYNEVLFNTAEGMQIMGTRIIPTTLVSAGDYLIGDFDLSTLYTKENINIQMGLDGNDFSQNMRTILAEFRGALVVKHNRRSAFISGDFATDMAAMETA